MRALMRLILAMSCVAMLAGCATSRTIALREPTSPQFFSGLDEPELYSGHKLNVAALQADTWTLGYYYSRGIVPPKYPALDLVPSLAADTLMAPMVLLLKADESIDGFVDVQMERYPGLRLAGEIPIYLMMAPFVAVISAQEYVGTQIAEFRAAHTKER